MRKGGKVKRRVRCGECGAWMGEEMFGVTGRERLGVGSTDACKFAPNPYRNISETLLDGRVLNTLHPTPEIDGNNFIKRAHHGCVTPRQVISTHVCAAHFICKSLSEAKIRLSPRRSHLCLAPADGMASRDSARLGNSTLLASYTP
jgi:hypothetical protein